MAATIEWVRPRLKEIKASYDNDRGLVQAAGIHKRTPDNVAELYRGAHYALTAMVEMGAITQHEADSYRRRIESGLLANVPDQDRSNQESDPVENLIVGVRNDLFSGRFHITLPDGGMPTEANQLGWLDRGREVSFAPGMAPTAQGERLGIYEPERNAIVADMDVLYRAATCMSTKVEATSAELPRRLLKAGLLAYHDNDHATTRSGTGGRATDRKRRYVALRADLFIRQADPPKQESARVEAIDLEADYLLH
jgi:hypothetical protein